MRRGVCVRNQEKTFQGEGSDPLTAAERRKRGESSINRFVIYHDFGNQ